MNAEYEGTNPLIDSVRIFMDNQKQAEKRREEAKKAGSITDPFEEYGYGVLAYFDMLRYLIVVFMIICVLFIPIFVMYADNNVLQNFSSSSFYNVLSLGNIGQAGPQCIQQMVGLERTQKLECSRGKITGLTHHGLTPVRQAEGAFAYSHCGNHEMHEPIRWCTLTYVDSARLVSSFSEQCEGQSSCEFNMIEHLHTELGDYRDEGQASTDFCMSKASLMYMQFSCDYSEIKASQQKIGLYVACTTVIIGMIWTLTIYYAKEKASMEFTQWDLLTATAADFTVQVGLTPSIWDEWNKYRETPECKETSFKEHVKRSVVEQVKAKNPVLENAPEVDVACISFAYDNSKVLNLLAQRGRLLA